MPDAYLVNLSKHQVKQYNHLKDIAWRQCNADDVSHHDVRHLHGGNATQVLA